MWPFDKNRESGVGNGRRIVSALLSQAGGL